MHFSLIGFDLIHVKSILLEFVTGNQFGLTFTDCRGKKYTVSA